MDRPDEGRRTRIVGDRGPKETATVMVVGEAPGRNEVQQGLPFVGPSGQVLNDWVRAAGFDTKNIYYTNVLQTMPQAPGGSIDEALKRGTVTQAQIAAGIARVQATACTLPHLKVIVPCGNYAASAFTSWGKVQWDTKRVGITSCRGSICGYTVTNEEGQRIVKVVPTIHPAFILREPSFEKRALADWRRIRDECAFPELNLPQRQHNITPDLDEIRDFYESLDAGTVLAIDIETWGDKLRCIGFATSPNQSLVIPTTDDYWGDLVSTDIPMEWVRRLCEHPCDKVLQNGLFDAWWLQEYDIEINGYWWDTLAMHHCFDALDAHSLEYLASVFTREPYWKDEAKSAEAILKVADRVGMERLYVYNGLDVTVTFEIFEKLHDLLKVRGRLKFYLHHYADMLQPLLDMMRGGVRVDRDHMVETREQLLADMIAHRDYAGKVAGEPMFTPGKGKCEVDMQDLYYHAGLTSVDKLLPPLRERGYPQERIYKKWEEQQAKGISDVKLIHTIHTKLQLSHGARTDKGRIQVDNIALKKIINRVKDRRRAPMGYELESWQEQIITLANETIACRRSMKLAGFLNPKRIDSDNRMRCTYKFNTKSGRLASAENPRGTGTNLQNFDSTLHHVFQPSPGNVMLEVDLSQAESRVVKVLTGNAELIEMARLQPHEFDEHQANAAIIFQCSEDEVTGELRDIGKRVNHATNYGMKGKRLSEILEKAGYVYTTVECQELIDRVHERFPALREWHSKIRKVILRDRQLYTSWGRYVSLADIRLDEPAWKFAYSWIPQSEIGDLLNQHGLIPLSKAIKAGQMQSRIVLQVHDSLVIDCPPAEVYDIMLCLQSYLSQERTYGGCLGLSVPLSIPCGFTIGRNWSKEKEWKVLPVRDEVEAFCHSLVDPETVEVYA